MLARRLALLILVTLDLAFVRVFRVLPLQIRSFDVDVDVDVDFELLTYGVQRKTYDVRRLTYGVQRKRMT